MTIHIKYMDAEQLLSQALLHRQVALEIKQDKNLILKSCGIDVIQTANRLSV